MDLDRLMIEWNDQRCEGYLFETPPATIMADIQKKCGKNRRRYRLKNYAGILLLAAVIAGTVVAIRAEHSLAAAAITVFVMAAVFCELLFLLKWRAEDQKKPYHLGRRDFLVEERKRVLRRIRLTRWQIVWYSVAVPVAAADLLLGFLGLGGLLGFLHPGEDVLDFLTGFVTPLLFIHLLTLIVRRKDLPRDLERIDRDLAKFDAVTE